VCSYALPHKLAIFIDVSCSFTNKLVLYSMTPAGATTVNFISSLNFDMSFQFQYTYNHGQTLRHERPLMVVSYGIYVAVKVFGSRY
jgi:hypothetical protein